MPFQVAIFLVIMLYSHYTTIASFLCQNIVRQLLPVLSVDQLHIVLVEEEGLLELRNGGFSVCDVQPGSSRDAVQLNVVGEYARLWVTDTLLHACCLILSWLRGTCSRLYRFGSVRVFVQQSIKYRSVKQM